MKLLVTGKTGQVGSALAKISRQQNIPAFFTDRKTYSVNQTDRLHALLTEHRPSVVIHTAAYTQVDKTESESDTAYLLNAVWPGQIAKACAEHAIPLLHLSTDFVFSGQKKSPYTEEDLPHPISVYGKSKLAGEMEVRAHLHHHVILRVAWIYSDTGRNFCKTILTLAKEKDTLKIVNDQTGSPTTAMNVAEAILHVAKQLHEGKKEFGLFHFTSQGHTTWYGFAKEIIKEASAIMPLAVQKIVPITTAEYPTPALRPAYSVLDTSRIQQAYGITGRFWKEGVKETIPYLVNLL